jgi:hypothetical protein
MCICNSKVLLCINHFNPRQLDQYVIYSYTHGVDVVHWTLFIFFLWKNTGKGYGALKTVPAICSILIHRKSIMSCLKHTPSSKHGLMYP